MTTVFLRRRRILAFSAAILVSVAVPAHAGADSAVLTPIHQLVAGLLQVMKAGRATPFSKRFDMLAPVIDKTFDLTTILKTSVGPAWDRLPHDQQSLLIKAFRRYTIASYVSGFDEDNEHFVINPDVRVSGKDEVVRMQIVPDAGDEYELDHVLRLGPAGWQVVDILADGIISRVAVQRSDFRQLMRQGGAPALAKSLDQKSADLAAG